MQRPAGLHAQAFGWSAGTSSVLGVGGREETRSSATDWMSTGKHQLLSEKMIVRENYDFPWKNKTTFHEKLDFLVKIIMFHGKSCFCQKSQCPQINHVFSKKHMCFHEQLFFHEDVWVSTKITIFYGKSRLFVYNHDFPCFCNHDVRVEIVFSHEKPMFFMNNNLDFPWKSWFFMKIETFHRIMSLSRKNWVFINNNDPSTSPRKLMVFNEK